MFIIVMVRQWQVYGSVYTRVRCPDGLVLPTALDSCLLLNHVYYSYGRPMASVRHALYTRVRCPEGMVLLPGFDFMLGIESCLLLL